MVPFVFVGLLVFGVMIGAQTLMTSTVEEKSSRVIEVLLSAVSPLELMAGKILGQMAVSLLVLALYIGIGVLMLSSFAMLGLLDPWLIVYLVIFFLITYFLFASVFGAIGAAVNEMREAQALVTPVMLVLMAAVAPGGPGGARSQHDVRHRAQLHPAGQHAGDDDPHGVHVAAAALAGVALDRASALAPPARPRGWPPRSSASAC